jgi:GNAT superfamily N-acetyltransferase
MRPELDSRSAFKFSLISSLEANQQFSNLLDLSFPVDKNSRFLDDFPIWDCKFHVDSVQRLGLFYGERLVSSCAVRYGDLKNLNPALRHLTTPVILIGAVATHPFWRGKGLASLLVDRAIAWGENQGAALALLWGSEHTFYQRLGFELCGEQIRVPFAKNESPG